MTTNPHSIAIAGAGYVGLVTAAGLAMQGHEVWCAETNADKLQRLQQGEVDITEDGLAEAVDAHRDRLHFVQSVGEALSESGGRLLFVTVGTPPRPDGTADLTQVEAVIEEVPATSHVTVVMKSTVPPGTGAAIMRRAAEQRKRFAYVSCPEFLQEGAALATFVRPDRVVVGSDDPAARELMRELHRRRADAEPLHPVPLVETDVTTAEMIKHAANFHLALRISFANQVANLCEELGADAATVMGGIGLDRRIGPEFLEPGIGFGGSCLTKDVQALSATARRVGSRLTLGDALLDVNEEQADRVIRKLLRHLGSLEGRTVALLGLAFKANTDDLRCSSAFALARRLRHHHAVVRAYDPDDRARSRALAHSEHQALHTEWIAAEELASSALDALEGADACVLVTAWDDFVALDWTQARTAMTGDLVIDGRNALDPDAVREAGLAYEGTGRMSAGLWRAPRTAPPATGVAS